MPSPPELHDRPQVTLHFAQSLDGRIATRSGAARWISGPPATRFAHELRAAADAVIIGSGTAIADDPLLTVRHVEGAHPLRIVLDGRGRVPAGAKLFTDRTSPTIHATANRERVPPPHVERWLLPVAPDGQGVDLAALLARAREHGLRSVLVEGGRGIITSFLRARLVDRIIVTVAPMILGEGIDAVGDLAIRLIDDALRFTAPNVLRLGDDVILDLKPRSAAP